MRDTTRIHTESHQPAASLLTSRAEEAAEAATSADGTEKLDSVAPPLARSQQSKPVDQFEQNRITKQQLAHGRALFNSKPKKGLQYLIDTHHITNSPQDIGRFLYQHSDTLDKVKVGEWIGGRCVSPLSAHHLCIIGENSTAFACEVDC